MKLNRNDTCHCKSGKKYKDCHGGNNKLKVWKKYLIISAVSLILLWLFKDMVQSSSDSSGVAPPGKIWSEEHGHYHDISPSAPPPINSQNLNIPQPAGAVPPGKVWSRGHGHWHDVISQ